MFTLCDSETGIVLDMCIYSASDTDIPKCDPLGISGAMAKPLMKKYLGKGHMLYTANWYTSPALATFLEDHGTGAVGTVREKKRICHSFRQPKEVTYKNINMMKFFAFGGMTRRKFVF